MKTQASESPAPAPVSPLDVALGSVPLDVTYLDGRKATVRIHLLPLGDECEAFLRVQADHYAHAEFAAKQPEGWAKTLHPASVLDLVERSLDLNFPLVQRWAGLRTRQYDIAKGLGLLDSASPLRRV